MPLTRAVVEARLVNDWSQMLVRAGMSTASDGTNANLNWPIVDALLFLKIAPADISNVQDADLTTVSAARTRFFLALCDAFTAEAILGNVLARVDTQVGINRVDLADMAKGLEATIARLWAQVQAQFIRGQAQPAVGKLAPDPQPPDAATVPWVTYP